MLTPILLMLAQAAAVPVPPPADPATAARIEKLLSANPVIDGHNDLPWEIRTKYAGKVESVDLTRDTSKLPLPLQTDIPRLRKGHVGAQFWSVWITADNLGPRAVEMTLEEIDIVKRFVAANPGAFEMAGTAADIRRIEKSGKIAALMGVEGGHQIDGRLSVLRRYHDLGVRYMTLTHTLSLPWADASTDTPRSGGLSAFGKQVVAEMNRIGMIVDISHVSDATLAAVLAETKAPVMASHSSARALDNAPRNIPDDLLAAIGKNGGVVMVNFYPSFVSQAWRDWDKARTDYAKSVGASAEVYGPNATAPVLAWEANHPEPVVTSATIADHVEHIAKLAGKASIGLGSDYDGIDGTAPRDMTGVDGYPALFAELARRGWSDADLAGLARGNILRVMEKVEGVAKSMAGMPPIDATDRP
ncbi:MULTISPECIES: dipeptidase [unclassified Sphingomonas]|uniref:dipeptidase n=1 Tax=unclassified Sphingomonas TaxID=196159 RepID=UPI000BDB1E8D|nr:MAG: membrane dipeptidase [Sphingomonas sp. 12-62-6]OYX40436.1 MAG: membrane dipeptidase [Sphingomonas sp. 32-62-10]